MVDSQAASAMNVALKAELGKSPSAQTHAGKVGVSGT